ncbi:hypothetical protein [Streptomyces xanthophaeus]
MASKFNIGDRVRVNDDLEQVGGWLGTVDWITHDDFPDACGVMLDDDTHQLSAHFHDHELTLAKEGLTQREKLLALLTEFGITPAPAKDPEEEFDVVLEAKVGGVGGYSNFVCAFEFKSDGAFSGVGIWE